MLNEHETRIYEYIKKSLDKGIPPTVREICRELGYASTSTVNKYINNLREYGYIEKSENLKRNIKLAGYKCINIPVISMENYCQNFLDIENVTGYICWTPDKDYEYPLFAVKSNCDYKDIIKKDDVIIAENTADDGKKYYIEHDNKELYFTETNSPFCIGRIISIVKYI